MVKHPTHLLQRASPAAHRLHRPARHATRLAHPYQNSPFLAGPVNIPARGPGLRSRLSSTSNTNRFLAERTQLSTIREEPEEDRAEPHRYDDATPCGTYSHIEPWPPHDAAVRAGLSGRQDADIIGWDDETTLVAMLEESSSEQDEEERLIALVESIKGPMAAHGATLKQYMKDAFLPTYSRIKEAHGVLGDKVDLAFGAGVLAFDEVCKKVERIALRDEDELKTAHAESQRNIAKTLEELELAYARRDDLWATFEKDLDRCAARATAALDGLPADVEQTIARLEKKAKALDKDTNSAANQKMLRGLLEKV